MCSKGQRIVAVLGTYLYIVYRITHLDRSPTYIVIQMKDFLPTTALLIMSFYIHQLDDEINNLLNTRFSKT